MAKELGGHRLPEARDDARVPRRVVRLPLEAEGVLVHRGQDVPRDEAPGPAALQGPELPLQPRELPKGVVPAVPARETGGLGVSGAVDHRVEGQHRDLADAVAHPATAHKPASLGRGELWPESVRYGLEVRQGLLGKGPRGHVGQEVARDEVPVARHGRGDGAHGRVAEVQRARSKDLRRSPRDSVDDAQALLRGVRHGEVAGVVRRVVPRDEHRVRVRRGGARGPQGALDEVPRCVAAVLAPPAARGGIQARLGVVREG
mmetsp:Transcript_23262/g.78158  ORF Transcript_23262/g.78158 Transcript_23262/m.78158 type:complete len:260 (+) Transcript_23262:2089-2868(+)